MPLRQVGRPEMLALVEISGWFNSCDQLVGDLGARLAQRQAAGIAGHLERHFGRSGHDDGERSRPEAPRQNEEAVAQLGGQFLGHDEVADQNGQRAVRFAALGLEDLGHGAQVERVGHQRVERIGGDGHHFAAAHGGGGALQHFRLRLFGIDFDQVGCHFVAISARADGLGHVERHLVAAERRAQLYALDHAAHTRHHLARDGHAFLAGLFGVIHAPHALHELRPARARAARSP